jgi:hypothetical protein
LHNPGASQRLVSSPLAETTSRCLQEETLDERFVFTLKDDPKRQKNKKKGKRSAILSPRSLDKENLSASHQNETPSGGEGGELTKPRRKHSRSLILRPKRLRDDGPTSASAECLASAPVEVTGVAFTAPSSLPSLPSGPVGPLPPPPPDADSPPRVHLTPELDVTSPPPPPPLPPRDYDSDYALGGTASHLQRCLPAPHTLMGPENEQGLCEGVAAPTRIPRSFERRASRPFRHSHHSLSSPQRPFLSDPPRTTASCSWC